MFKKLVYLFIGIFFMQTTLHAAHLKGGWIKYEYIGDGAAANTSKYLVTVYQYLDCGSSGGQIDQNIFLGVFDGFTLAQQITIPLTNTVFEQKTTFQCIVNPPVICYRIDSYQTTIEVANNGVGYTLAVQRCCRIGSIVNLQNSSQTGVTYSTVIPGNGVSGIDYKNKSAVFAQEDTAVVCRNNSFSFAFTATDPDGDSLRYSFIEGFGTPSVTPVPNPPSPPSYPAVNYASPFFAGEPLGNNVSINPATGLISGVAPGTTGDYVVAVFVSEYRGGIKIAENRKELHIRVEACDIPQAELPLRQITCDGFNVTFENLSTSSGINNYYWDFGVAGVTTDTSTNPRPTFIYPDTGVYITKLVINRGDPCSDSTTTEVRVFPGFFPGFLFAGACKGVPFQFTDTSKTAYGFINSWSWNFGDPSTLADTSHIRNPMYTYLNAGSNVASLIVSSSKGCVDTAMVPIDILDKPPLMLPFKDTLICSIDTLQLHAVGTGSFSWAPNIRIINPLTADPFVNPLTTTTYTVTLNDRGCIAKDSVKVNVLPFINVDAGRDTTICRTDPITLMPISQALSYVWTPATALSNPRIKNPISTTTANSITYFVTANLGKCQAKDSVIIKTAPYPQANAGRDTTICFSDKVTLVGVAVGNIHNWSPASLVTNPTALITDGFPSDTTLFIFSVTDTLGCPKPTKDSVLVSVVPRVQVFAGRDTAIVIGQPLVFQATASVFVTQYLWTPATGISNTSLLQPTLTITPALYPVGADEIKYILTASSKEGCMASDDIIVKLFKLPPSIFVPSAFTPNDDGKNDNIKPILVGMKQLDFFRIFNRYGQLVFKTSEIGKGWNGKVKDELQGSAAYVYTAQAVDFNGNVVKANGTFVLIR